MKNDIWHPLGHAILTAAYVTGVSLFMSNIEKIFNPDKPDTFLAPLFMILLFVVSATITATLVLGRPILLYHDGRRAEALRFFGYTLLWLVVLLFVVFLVLMRG